MLFAVYKEPPLFYYRAFRHSILLGCGRYDKPAYSLRKITGVNRYIRIFFRIEFYNGIVCKRRLIFVFVRNVGRAFDHLITYRETELERLCVFLEHDIRDCIVI